MKRILAACTLVVLASACASHSTKTVSLKNPGEYAANASYDNFDIGAEAYDTDAKTQVAFDQKLVRKGIFPVQISMTNNSDTNLLVSRHQIYLDSNISNSVRPMNAAEVAEEVEANAIAHAVLGFGIFSYAAAKDANDEREADYANKQIAEEWIVRPGRTSGGFVFFRLGEGAKTEGRRLVIPIQDMSDPSDEIIAEIQL